MRREITYHDDSSSNYKSGAYANFKLFSISISEYITKVWMTEAPGRDIWEWVRLEQEGEGDGDSKWPLDLINVIFFEAIASL